MGGVAADSASLFEKVMKTRRQNSMVDPGRVPRENHVPTVDDETKARYERVLSTKDDAMFAINIFSRSSQLTCTYPRLLSGSCTTEEFCAAIESDPDTAAHCQGNKDQYWEIVMEDPEICYYADGMSGEPYDAERFNPDTDFCSQWKGMFFMNELEAESLEVIVDMLRPVPGRYREVNDLQKCDDSRDLGFITGYCDSCSAVAIDEQPCISCQSCPENSSTIPRRR